MAFSLEMFDKIRVTKEFDFEMAHALWNYDGACKNIHGHSYRLFVTIKGVPLSVSNDPKFGMVLDFKDLKRIVMGPVVEYLDHSLAVYTETDGNALSALQKMYEKVHIFDFQPTCRKSRIIYRSKIRPLLSQELELHSVKLIETATSYAEWYAADNK